MTTDPEPLADPAPALDGAIHVRGPVDRIAIRRDAHGIPHVEAANEHDAWFGMGYASAQDRLWQMEWYRRRGTGRWAEIAGPAAVEVDATFRRLRVEAASRADVDAMSAETRAMFEAYAAGVNAWIAGDDPLPSEFALAAVTPEPWEPWHSVLVFKVRHAIMGKRGIKLARAELLRRVGVERYALLEGIEPAGLGTILPPGGVASEVARQAAAEVERTAALLGMLGDDAGGSNSWVVHGSRTSTGRPVLCNDSHRPLDVPNVYWQAHVTCPDFNVAGAAFPGFPAFPHFGHNGDLAWNITHGQADYQDLYVEAFAPGDPLRYATEHGWVEATVERGEIAVAGADPVPIEVVSTRHGSIVHGDPRSGAAIAMRYTATDQASRQWETLRPMLVARTVPALHETQRAWVEPVNALLSADTDGNVGFLFRGRVPVRATAAARQFPVPGWTGEHEWRGDVPFEALPQSVNPDEGFFATANQRVQDGDDPYFAYEFTTPGRADRLAEILRDGAGLTPEWIASHQSDTVSLRARGWAAFLATQPPLAGEEGRSRELLAAWDGDLAADSAPALLYAEFRRRLARAVFAPIVGEDTFAWLTQPANLGGAALVSAWMYHLGATLDGSTGTPDGRPWSEVLPPVLRAAWEAASRVARNGDPSAWRWGDLHRTAARHPLSDVVPGASARLDPPAVRMGGDPDTVQVSGYAWSVAAPPVVTALSVYRQVVDFSEPLAATWSIPGGASGDPGSPHYADQLAAWAAGRRIPMHLDPAEARAHAAHELTLEPSSA